MLKAISALLLCLSVQYVVCQDDGDDMVSTGAPETQAPDTTGDFSEDADVMSTTDDSEDMSSTEDLSTTDDSGSGSDSDDSSDISSTDSGSDSDDSSAISSTEDSDSGSDSDEEDSEDDDSDDDDSDDDSDDSAESDDDSDDESQDDNASDDEDDDDESQDDDDDDDTSEEDDQDSDDDDNTTNDDTIDIESDDDQCVGLEADDCSDNYDDDGAQICALNIETNNCYEIVQSRGIYGKGNFDDGYNAAKSETSQETQQLNTVVGIMGGFIAVLVLVIVAGAYWVYNKQRGKVEVGCDDDDDHYRGDQRVRLSTAEDAEPMICAE